MTTKRKHETKVAMAILAIAVLFAGTLAPTMTGQQATAASPYWAKTMGTDGTDDMFRGTALACDGGYIVGGWSEDSSTWGTSKDIILFEIEEDGSVPWKKRIHSTGNEEVDEIRSICSGSEQGYILAGAQSGDVFVAKVDLDGDKIWAKEIQGPNGDTAKALALKTNGEIIVGGYTTVSSEQDFYIARLAADGSQVIEQKKYDFGPGDDVIREVEVFNESGVDKILVAGYAEDSNGERDWWVMKLNADSLGRIWQTTLGGPSGSDEFEEPAAIVQVSDGYLVMEESSSFTGTQAAWMVRLKKSDGTILKERTFDITTSGHREEFSAAKLTDGGDSLVVVGETGTHDNDGNFWVTKYDIQNDPPTVVFKKKYGAQGTNKPDQAESVQINSDGDIFVAGITESFGAGGRDIWMLKLNSNGQLSPATCSALAWDGDDTTPYSTSASNAASSSTTISGPDQTYTLANSGPTWSNAGSTLALATQCS